MTRRAWVRLDNASNIFLAARSDVDPKVFRLSAEMDHEVDPRTLQSALDTTYDRYPLYRAVLRSGVFWYYLQDSDLRPRVTAEDQHTCAPIYQAGRRSLLFRVVHHRRRIVLEIFHALSDGTGALWFLTDLVSAYLRLRSREQPGARGRAGGESESRSEAEAESTSGAEPGGTTSAEPESAAESRAGPGLAGEAEPTHELIPDSFAHYFRRVRGTRRTRAAPPAEDAFSSAAASAVIGAADSGPPPSTVTGRVPRPRGSVRRRVYRVRGTRSPDNRTRVVELTMPVGDVLPLAKAEGVTLTMYLTALFFESVRLASGGLGRANTLAASVPVNLRQFFPSSSARNFFTTIRVEHTYGEGPDDLGSICRRLEAQFRPRASPEALERKLRRFIRFERMPALRVVPRPLKDALLRLINWGNNRGLSVAVSNLGRVTLSEAAEPHVGRMLFHVSAVRPQFCTMTHAGLLTVSFTSPFIETDHIREFARMLTAAEVRVTAAAARVTEAELAEAEPAEAAA